jgi:hypothetical protein
MARPSRRSQQPTPSVSQNRLISDFVRVSKSLSLQEKGTGKKRQAEEEPLPTVTKKAKRDTEATVPDNISTKRVRTRFENQKEVESAAEINVIPATTETSNIEVVLLSIAGSKRSTRTKHSVALTAERTHRKASAPTIISQAKGDAKTAAAKLQRAHKTTKNSNPETSSTNRKSQKQSSTSQLPESVSQLAGLHRAFLTTVTFKFIHNGGNVPIDMRDILPEISRTWGVRAVTVEDIRRCVAVQGLQQSAGQSESKPGSPFSIIDYGRGKLCIELAPQYAGAHIDEETLNMKFNSNLHNLYAERAMDKMPEVDILLDGLSLSDVPQAPIASRNLVTSVNPELAKGQRALAELKSDRLAKREQKKALKEDSMQGVKQNGGQGLSLLDRIRMKQSALAQMASTTPSVQDLSRRASLQRVGDIASMLSMLARCSNSTNQARISFTMPIVLQKLKDSMRTPISNEEGAACVRLIASEIAPEWLKVVTMGNKEHVIIQTRMEPLKNVVQERVTKLVI